jgi:ubiquinone/menaquinone biosynthesis C-methylase UbiE
MDFYSELAEYYDLAFPFEKTIGSFLRRHLTEGEHSGKNILDIACGTGTYTAYLAENEITITGMDFNQKMITEANRRFRKNNLQFVTGNMLNLNEIPGEGDFDGIYCIGNSIVHLETEKEIGIFLGQCQRVMVPGGTLIIQIINFDRIIDQKIESLPTLETEEIEFRRNYSLLDDSHVSFNTVIKIKQDGKSFSNSIPLIALRKNRLIELLEDTGFRVIETFGSYSEEKWEKGSFLTIISAQIPLNCKIP